MNFKGSKGEYMEGLQEGKGRRKLSNYIIVTKLNNLKRILLCMHTKLI